MNRKLLSILGALVVVFLIFFLLVVVGGQFSERLQTGENPLLRFVFVAIGCLIAFVIYAVTSQNPIWEVNTRQVVYMAIGAALYAVFSYLFNGTVFAIPSTSQVALRPAIVIPMFFGYSFGPVVGFFSGAVGNMFGDALTGFGLSPQWSIGNGLVGFIAGLAALSPDKKKGLNSVLIAGAVLTVVFSFFYLLNPTLANMTYFDVENNIFGDQQITLFAGISIVIGFVLVLVARFAFGQNIDVAAAVTWSMLGSIVGIGFAAISDIWINGYPPALAIVGEFLPAAGPNLIFAAILVPILIGAYASVQRQSGR